MKQVSSGPTPQLPQTTAGRPAAIPQASTTVPRVMTAADVEALRARRSELSNQLSSASSRRKDLARELRTADGANRVGLEGRMTQLDQRIMNIENDLAETGRQLSSLPAGLVATSTTSLPMQEIRLNPGQLTGISIVFTIFVLFPLVAGRVLLRLRRSSQPHQPAIPAETERRLERIEQAVDTIAIEVERISEGQRFVTQLMNRNAALALGEARDAAVPVPVERHAPGDERR